MKEKDHDDIAYTIRLLSNIISVCHVLIVIFLLLLSILFSSLLFSFTPSCTVVLYFDPARRCCPQSSFSSSILLDGRRSICFFIPLYSVVHSRAQSMGRKKNLLSLRRVPILNECLSVQNGRTFHWLCFKIISFS